MSKNEIVSMIETMNNYDELASKAKAKADAIRDALKEEMLRLETEELNAGAYIVRYTSVISNRFDSTTFKRLYADVGLCAAGKHYLLLLVGLDKLVADIL